ncbi:hypothetical protein DHEL01_v210985 [Diaporthe helianthi]|uniref:Uncharacterized protein n=1 Tax=Diaporthe helianthi TaxID=158607 RepID=A0A2P5HK33_DIAHE|nr:hypothetical protein DHEL01_v210985 [Diaporthe helianthi]
MSPPSRIEEQGDLVILDTNAGGSEIKSLAHRPPTPALSDGFGISDHCQVQPQPVLTILDICSNTDQDGNLLSLNEANIFEQWPLMDAIDLDHWGPALASPPDEPHAARLTSTPQDSVPPLGSTPANEVSQQQADLIDLLGGTNRQSIVEPTSQAVQSGQPPPHAPEDSRQPECRCLQSVVFLIDELEAGRSTVESQGLDAGLASHKEALRYGQALIECQRCRLRPEHMTILKFLTDKLAGLSEQIVAEYARGLMHPAAVTNEIIAGGNTSSQTERSGSGAPPWPAVLGSYEVDSAREWDTVIGGLIGLQLEALHSLAESMKAVSRSMHWDAMFGRATATQRRIVPMMYRIQSLCRPGGGTVDATVFSDPS